MRRLENMDKNSMKPFKLFTWESFATYVQEYFAVIFQLITLSRLGTGEITSNLVLLLTLVVFTGPLLNTWLMLVQHICIKGDVFIYLPVAIVIIGTHIAGSCTSWAIVNAAQPEWSKNNITWVEIPGKIDTGNKLIEFLDECFGVLSLLIGCVYLFWLQIHDKEVQDKIKEVKNDKRKPPWFDIQFFLRLTLLVASVSRAFPTAHLSLHVSIYKWGTGQITPETFWSRFGGGILGVFLTVVFALVRTKFRAALDLPDEDEQDESKIRLTQKGAEMVPFTVSFRGGNYL